MTAYDVFISYARQDNIPDASGVGWVTAIRDAIEADARGMQGRGFNVFFDATEIHDMQDWQDRIRGALRTSKVLLVCLSPNYFGSEPCHWEWEEYLQRQARTLATIGAGESDDGSVASVFFVDAPELTEASSRAWRDSVMRFDGVDLRPWFPFGPREMQSTEVRERISSLGDSIHSRIERARRAESAVGNVVRFNPYFIGRGNEFAALHTSIVSPGTIGVVATLHGQGGQGKTELAIQFAHAYRDLFVGGVWQLAADRFRVQIPAGRPAQHEVFERPMLELAATLGDDPRFRLKESLRSVGDRASLGREVLAALDRLASETGPVMVLFDNVSDAELLSEPAVALLPRNEHLHYIATTRLGPEEFASARGSLRFIEVGPLSTREGVALIRDHQPSRGGNEPDFASQEQCNAAASIVSVLDGFTLAVEQVAVYLGVHVDTSPKDFYDMLLHEGLTVIDDAVIEDSAIAANMRHREKTLSAVMRSSLADLRDDEVAILSAAALLPPDEVPFPWLQTLLCELETEFHALGRLERHRGRWPRIVRKLSGRRLLTLGDETQLGRIHRLHAAHVAPLVPASVRSAVVTHLVTLIESVARDEVSPSWTFRVLAEALLMNLEDNNQLANAVNNGAFLRRVRDYVGGDIPDRLSLAMLAACETSARESHDPDDQLRLVVALNNAGRTIQFNDPDHAARLFSRAQNVCESNAKVGPKDHRWGRLWSISINNHAAVIETSDPTRALDLYKYDRDLAIERAAARPTDRVAQLDAWLSLNSYGRALGDIDPSGALEEFTLGLALIEELESLEPSGVRPGRDVSLSLSNVAGILEHRDPHRARTLYLRDIEIIRELWQSQPGNLQAARDYSMSLSDFGRILRHIDPTQATSFLRGSLAIREDLVKQQPSNRRARRDLMVVLNALGRVVERVDPTEAGELFERALAIAEELAISDPSDLYAQRELAVALNNVVRMRSEISSVDSINIRVRILDITQSLAVAQPSSIRANRDLAAALSNLGHAIRFNDPPSALDYWQQDLKISESLSSRVPEDLELRREHAVSLVNVARALTESQPQRAQILGQRAVGIFQHLADLQPDDSQAARDLELVRQLPKLFTDGGVCRGPVIQ